MKNLLLILVAILSVLGMSTCKTSEEQTDLDTYDYYLLIVESRQSLSQGNYLYIMHEAGKPLTSDSITYESDELWSVGEFVIAIELDEEGSVYFTDVDTTTSIIVDQYQEQCICDLEQFAVDMQVACNDGYSIERNVNTGIIYELLNGEYTGEKFDYNYFFNKYCTVGELHENK